MSHVIATADDGFRVTVVDSLSRPRRVYLGVGSGVNTYAHLDKAAAEKIGNALIAEAAKLLAPFPFEVGDIVEYCGSHYRVTAGQRFSYLSYGSTQYDLSVFNPLEKMVKVGRFDAA